MELSFLSLDVVTAFGGKMFVFLAGLAALIFVHELGHFLVARKVGVIVEKFSLGFGPKIFGVKSGGTEYLLCAIPLGGYVKMKGEDYEDSSLNVEGSFAAAKVQHRLAIAFAGPLFNFLFAVAIYWVVYLVGVQTLGLVAGSVRPESPAQMAGIQSGDKVVAIDGEPVRFFSELQDIVHDSPGKSLQFQIERNGSLLSIPITPLEQETVNIFGEKEMMGLVGISPLMRNITRVAEGSAAEKAGILEGDILLKVDETPIHVWEDFRSAAIKKPGQELKFHVLRDGTEHVLTLTPEPETMKDKDGKKIEIGKVGIAISGELVEEKYGIFGALGRSFKETGQLIYLIAVSIKKLIFGSIPANTIGGPILIFQVYGDFAEQGFNQLIRLTALLSINLGLLNLLPIPVLDGGHILFFLIEIIKGKPVSEKNRERAQQVGIFMLLGLMVFAFYNDIVRIVS